MSGTIALSPKGKRSFMWPFNREPKQRSRKTAELRFRVQDSEWTKVVTAASARRAVEYARGALWHAVNEQGDPSRNASCAVSYGAGIDADRLGEWDYDPESKMLSWSPTD